MGKGAAEKHRIMEFSFGKSKRSSDFTVYRKNSSGFFSIALKVKKGLRVQTF